jgi:hypothetical protein
MRPQASADTRGDADIGPRPLKPETAVLGARCSESDAARGAAPMGMAAWPGPGARPGPGAAGRRRRACTAHESGERERRDETRHGGEVGARSGVVRRAVGHPVPSNPSGPVREPGSVSGLYIIIPTAYTREKKKSLNYSLNGNPRRRRGPFGSHVTAHPAAGAYLRSDQCTATTRAIPACPASRR